MFRKKKNKGVNNFDKVYYINYEHRSNRISHINDVLTNLDIDSDRIERIEGVYIKGNDALSYIKSQLAVLKDAVKNKYDNILILEDDFIAYNDFVFIDSINDLFQSNLSWDIISMCDTISSTECEYDFLVKISEANNRGGYAINKKSIKKTIAYLSEMISNDLITTPIDNIWNKLQLNWYGFKQPLGTKIIFNDDSDMIDSHVLCMITTYNRRRFLEKTIDTWNKTRNKNYKWTLIIADDGSNDGTLEYLDSLKISDVEIKIIKNSRRGVHHQTNQLFKLALDMEFDFGFKCDDDLIFLKSGWDDLYINVANKTKYYHLIHYGRKHERLRSTGFGGILESYVEGKSVHGALWTFNREVLDKVGFFDLNSFNVFGFGHVDYSMRCCRMGFNNIENPYDIANSNDFVVLNGEEYFSEKTGMDLWNSKEQIEEKRRILDEDRGYVGYNELGVNVEGCEIQSKTDINFFKDFKIVVELPFYSSTSGGVIRMMENAKYLSSKNINTIIRFQRLVKYPCLELKWTVGLPDNTFPDCDVCITYSDNPYLEDLLKLSQVKKVIVYMLSYGMSIERERKNVSLNKVIVTCSTKKIQNAILKDNKFIKVHRIGFEIDTKGLYNLNKKRNKYLAILYHPSKNKHYEMSVKIADNLFKENKIEGVITFGCDNEYNKYNHPIGLVKHYSEANRDEIRDIFNNCVCFLMPSTTEGLNLTPIEATLCGCPSVICDGAINEVFYDLDNCLISNFNEIELEKKVVDIINNFEVYSIKFQKNMELTIKKFTYENLYKKLIELF